MVNLNISKTVKKWQLQSRFHYDGTFSVTSILSPLLLVAFVLGIASPTLGATPNRPIKKDCQGLDKNERIACKHENLNAELYDLVDKATNDGGNLFTPAQREHLKNARERAEKARIRKRDAGEFNNFGKKSKVKCAIKEYVDPDCYDPDCDQTTQAECDGFCEDPFPENDDSDDICTGNELCAEALNDGYGDDDGLCDQKGQLSKREPCLEVCDDSVSLLDQNYEPEADNDFEEAIDDVTLVLGEANQEIDTRLEMMSTLAPIMEGNYAGSGDCGNLKLIANQRKYSYTQLQGTLAGANVAQGLLEVCENSCGQTSLGFNCRAICLVLAIAHGALETIHEAFALQDDYITTKELEAALGCLEQTDGKLEEVLVKQDNTETELLIIKSLLSDAIELLNTPQGRRDDFPVK